MVNTTMIYDIMQSILMRENAVAAPKDHFWMLGLDSADSLHYIELVSYGSFDDMDINPMQIYRWAVMKGSAKTIMVHHHASGSLEPTEADKEVSDRLIQVGRLLGISLVDHLIINTEGYTSFLEIGLMDQLGKSTKWIPQYELEERIREEQKRLQKEVIKTAMLDGKVEGQREGEAKGEQLAKIKIAHKLLKLRMPQAQIMEATGLSKDDIEALQ